LPTARRPDVLPALPLPAAVIICVVLGIVLASPGRLLAAEAEPLPVAEMQDTAPYRVVLAGAPDDEMQELLQSVSATFGSLDRPPASLSLLRRRAESDVEPMIEALRSFGYFKAHVGFELTEAPEQKPLVTFSVEPGPRFAFGRIDLGTTPGAEGPDLPTAESLGLSAGAPYRAAQVVAARDALLRHYADRAHPFAALANMRVVADHADDRVAVTFTVDPGPAVTFGPTRIEGLSAVEEDFVRLRLPWHAGEPYDASLVERGRLDLFHSGLYSLVEIAPAASPGPEGERALTLTLKERAPRSVRVGLGYTTDFGPGLTFGWEHRNLFGRAENLNLNLSLDQKRRLASAAFRKPLLFGEDQSLVLKTDLADEKTDAYDGLSWDTSGVIERELSSQLTVAGGLGLRHSDVRQAGEDRRSFNMVYIPLTGNLDTRDDVLNPTRGFLLSGLVSPYQDILDPNIHFLKHRFTGNLYLPLLPEDRLVLAGRASFGQILGQNMSNVSPDLRYYAGGGGSVRGFGYQLAGSLHRHDPVGGLSVLEFSAEARIKITETIGLVPFLDAGRAYEESLPEPGEELFYGAGLGLRYYTDFGPLRLDVAVPLNPRTDVDSKYQVYVSIGQSF
jgi:translocation and assembly module TamA